MDKDTSEIAKLSERIAKDPKSKLFVPLAEEYKKIGQIDTAIAVLTEGLRNNPGYATARSFLGRLLLEQGDLAGAQKELEEVVKAIPDNLLAQRKLGDLFVLLGKNSAALERFKVARALNPVDKDLAAIVEDLEAGRDVSARIPKPKGQKAPAESKPQEAPAAPQQPPQKAVPTAPAAAAPAPVRGQQPADAPVPKVPPVKPAAQPAPAAKAVPAVPDVTEIAPEEIVEEISEADILDQPAVQTEPVRPRNGPAAETLPPIKPKTVDEPGSASFDLNESISGSQPETDLDQGVAWSPAEPAISAAAPGDDINTDTLAELYIAQGFYDKAIEIYQRMLTDRPDNKALQQKLLKLHALAGAQNAASFPVPPARPAPPAAAVTAAPRETSPARESADAVKRPEAGNSAETARPGGSIAANRRKETIDRLESWLKNVVKEKPQ